MWRRPIHVIRYESEEFFVVNACVGEVRRNLYEKLLCYFYGHGELFDDEWNHQLHHLNGFSEGPGSRKPFSQRSWWGPYARPRLLIAPYLFGRYHRNFFHFRVHRSCESANDRRGRKDFDRHDGTVRFTITLCINVF